MKTVSVYDINGWLDDFPPLKYGRYHHACSHYLSSSGEKVNNCQTPHPN